MVVMVVVVELSGAGRGATAVDCLQQLVSRVHRRALLLLLLL